MNRSDIEHEVLSAATENWTALWELTSTCEKLLPYHKPGALRDRVREAVRNLIEKGHIYLCYFYFRENRCDQVPPEEIEPVLTDLTSWELPTSDMHPRVGATDAGMDANFGSREAWQPWTTKLKRES